MTNKRRALSAQNKRAWDALYGSTDSLIWGGAATDFLPDGLLEATEGMSLPLRALDAGTGEGRNLPALVPFGHVHGCDASSHALRKVPLSIRKRVHLHRCDLSRMPFGRSSFDLVVAVDVVETLPRPQRVLGEIARVLRPGGRLLCNIPGFEDEIAGVNMRQIGESRFLFHGRFFYQFFTEEEAVSLLESCGFTVRSARIHTWTEPAHPNFRDAPHDHTSRVFIAEKRP
jgi:SAM-dependent methyltransferase